MNVGVHAGAVGDHALHGLRHLKSIVSRDSLHRDRGVDVRLAVGELDALNGDRFHRRVRNARVGRVEEDRATDALAAVGNRGVGVGHLKRCDANEQAAETDGWLAGVDRRDDSHAVRDVGDNRRLDQHGQLCEDRVVRQCKRLVEVEVLAVAVLGVDDVPELAAAEIEQLL